MANISCPCSHLNMVSTREMSAINDEMYPIHRQINRLIMNIHLFSQMTIIIIQQIDNLTKTHKIDRKCFL